MSIHQENGGYVGCSYEDTQDPYWNYCVLALPLWDNGTGTLATTDLSPSPKTITNNGVTWQTTIKNFYGGASSFNGSSNSLTLPDSSDFAFGTGDFTVECWAYQTTSVNYPPIIEIGDHVNTNSAVFVLRRADDSSFFPTIYSGGFYNGSIQVSLNTWTHIAYVRSSGSLRIYVNGVSGTPVSFTNNLTNSSGNSIGTSGPTFVYWFPGYLQDLKIYKGIAKYISNFTPPTRSLVSQARRYPSGVFSL